MPRLVVRPLKEFLDTEASGGILLLLAVIAALAWANSPWQAGYERLWSTEASVSIGTFELHHDLRHWINDGLMTIFFFVVGLEVKSEMTGGELAGRRRAAFPVIGAIGGMVVPGLVYLIFNAGGNTAGGWAVPMATDIAFAIGVLALFGSRIPSSLRVFMLTLAIADDIGAIVVIAAFYAGSIDVALLGIAGGGLLLTVALKRLRVWWLPAYVAIGIVVWFATLLSGVHATIAGVALGLLTPAAPLKFEAADDLPTGQEAVDVPPATAARNARLSVHESTSVAQRLEHELHPWTSFAIVPLFALANAGVVLDRALIGAAASSSVTTGIVAGLVLGKPVGIAGFAWIAHRLGWAALPEGARWGHVVAVGAVAGIGFTVSLFIAGLAFSGSAPSEEAKLGILAGSLLAAIAGALLIHVEFDGPGDDRGED
ncbi:MAG: Na+/H+ antiporter NhaA [Actinobacteria bacterium]|nr:Na+/H+ antiporter NhaA [Actinomycetota bacterium]